MLDALLRQDPQAGSGYAGILARVLKNYANDLKNMITCLICTYQKTKLHSAGKKLLSDHIIKAKVTIWTVTAIAQ